MARLAIALSGGVDSTLAAWLLKQDGHELLALTLNLGIHAAASLPAAARAAAELGISHQIVDAQDPFQQQIIDTTINSYCQGKTPNPCARCNAFIKIPLLLEQAKALGCEGLATGHYARLQEEGGRIYLQEALDTSKSQTYFLARLEPELLPFLHFPLGSKSKQQVWDMAAALGLSAASSKESQDCCFMPASGFASLVEKQIPPSGSIVNSSGRLLGRHQGLFRYTIGQRRGLGIPASRPLYVLKLNAQENSVVVGFEEEL